VQETVKDHRKLRENEIGKRFHELLGKEGLNEAVKYAGERAKELVKDEAGKAEDFEDVPPDWYTETPEPRQWCFVDGRANRQGVMPQGEMGLLIAAGGAGKTMTIVQLTIAQATGGRWFGAFEATKPGKVLLVLGEEDKREARRRLYRAARLMDVVPTKGSIVLRALKGTPCQLTDERGNEAPFLEELREYVKKTGPYALIILDPLARFAGRDTEKDQHAATRFVQACETLIEPAGGAFILVSHHTNQTSRGKGATLDATSARGVTGITDGSRWTMALQVDRIDGTAEVTLSMVKTNYSMYPAPVVLRFEDGGVLVPATEEEKERLARAREEADPKAKRARERDQTKTDKLSERDSAITSALRRSPGLGTLELRKQVMALAKCGAETADVSIERMQLAGRIRRERVGQKMAHFAVEGVTVPANDVLETM
jgi:hypothetical protein